MSAYERLIVSKADGIGWLILDRPEAGNAFDALMLDELEAAWADLDTDPDVKVIVNAANGRAFCTGMDVVQVARDKAAMRRHSRRTRDAELKISSWHCDVWKPVIAAVNGVCAGGACIWSQTPTSSSPPSRRPSPTPRLHRAGRRVRGDHAAAQVADGGRSANDAERQG